MEKKATRNGFGEEILELGRKNKDILVVDADIGKSCKTDAFAHELEAQHINVGIAEQNAAGVAAGLATCGKIPFVVTYAVFGSLRMCEMIRQEIAYPKLNVKIAGSHGGLTPANDGASHQAVEDIGVMRSIPNMTVIMPADYWSARALVRAAVEQYGPIYLRFTRDAIPVIYDADTKFEIGKAHVLQDGKDLAIIANGDTVCLALVQKTVLPLRLSICTLSNRLILRRLRIVLKILARSSPPKITTSTMGLAVLSLRSWRNLVRAKSDELVSRIDLVSPRLMRDFWQKTVSPLRIS